MRKLIPAIIITILLLNSCNQAANITVSDVVAAFQNAALEAENARPLTKDDYGLAPYVCKGQRIELPSLCPECGGRIFQCSDSKDLAELRDYYVELGKSSAMFFSWVFEHENILVQLNGDLSEETANQYKTALESLGK